MLHRQNLENKNCNLIYSINRYVIRSLEKYQKGEIVTFHPFPLLRHHHHILQR
jgi:hypothetical protein